MLSRNPFHLVEVSPWPLLGSLSGMFVVSGLAFWFGGLSLSNSKWGLLMMGLVMYTWWRDVSREAGFQGFHGLDVNYGLRWGMMLFICSEVLFFFGFFWGFFHSSLAPTTELGSVWPPVGIYVINPFSIPLLNTAVLLGSGVSVTWAHHSLIEGDMNGAAMGLFWTVALGVYFTLLQKAEYVEASFSISEGVYGSIFFVATGFHGLHVLVGTSMLLVCLMRVKSEFFSSHHHFGFEASAWYWHFVDVVWIFLYMSIYWWGS